MGFFKIKFICGKTWKIIIVVIAVVVIAGVKWITAGIIVINSIAIAAIIVAVTVVVGNIIRLRIRITSHT